MAENEFPKIFKCPKCGSEKTVVGMALAPLKISGEVPIGAFGSIEKKLIPLMPPQQCKIAVPCLVICTDVCYDCGTDYASKVARVQIPKDQFARPGMINLGNI